MTQGQGFSLVEMMVALALLAILAGLAVPAFHDLLERNRIAGEVNQLLTHLQLARSRAVMGGGTVVICPTADGSRCLDTGNAWSQGWMVFRDADYQQPPTLDADDEVLLVHRNDGSSTTVHGNLTHIRYSATGSASNRTLILCGRNGSKHARAIIINIAGRARMAHTDANGGALTCDGIAG